MGADAVYIVFDVCNGASFVDLEGRVAEARQYTCPDIPILLVGNKIDGKGSAAAAQRLGGMSKARAKAKT